MRSTECKNYEAGFPPKPSASMALVLQLYVYWYPWSHQKKGSLDLLTLHFPFSVFEHLSINLGFWASEWFPGPWANIIIILLHAKIKKDSRHSCRRADWFSCLGMKYTSVLFLNLVIVWLYSTLSLPGDFAHHGTKAEGTSIWVLTSKRGSGELISDHCRRSWEGHLWSLPAQHLCPLSLAWLAFGETLPSLLTH